jgi:hypothetical protein
MFFFSFDAAVALALQDSEKTEPGARKKTLERCHLFAMA